MITSDVLYTNPEPSTGLNTAQLLDEISTAGLPSPDVVNSDGANVFCYYASALTSGQQSTLANTIASHVANPNYVTFQAQADIATLVGYLNNSNAATANTARAILIETLAAKLPDGAVASINAQVATALAQGA